MSLSTLRRPLRAASSVALALVMGLSPLAMAQGPFEPGLRWIDGAGLLEPWIPTSVSFAAADNLVWVGAGVGADRVLAYDAPGAGVASPALLDSSLGSGVNLLNVAAGAGAEHLFALTQREAPDAFNRVSEVHRWDLLQSSAGAPFAPIWTHDLAFGANGPARFDTDREGAVVVVAAWDDQTSLLRVDWVAADGGALLTRTDLVSAGLSRLVLADDGQRVALLAGDRLLVLSADGMLLHDQSLGGSPASLAMDESGQRILVGGLGQVRVFDWTSSAYSLVATRSGALDEVASHVGLSANGETWAAAWWRVVVPDLLRYQVYDGLAHTLVLETTQPGQVGGLQNNPVGVKLSRDGARVAFASWGKGDADPEVVLYDKATAVVVMAIDVPGSVMGFDLDASGTKLAVVTKNLHANLFSSTGEVRLYDTGERDLTLLSSLRLGGVLAAASKQPGASSALFMIGVRGQASQSVPGALGQLSLLRSGRLYIYARSADQTGSAQLSLPIPDVQGLIGMNYSMQVAGRVGAQLVFSETTVDLLFH